MYFTATSDKPYDRHHYKVVFKNGNEIFCESWESANQLWMAHIPLKSVKSIEVLDKPITRHKAKGF